MAATVQIIVSAVDKASRDLKKSENSLAGLAATVVGTSAAIAGFAVVARETWQTLNEGAAINQTAESFDLLLTKVSAAPDLLAQLDAAAGGTISEMELMSSTATLLAGTSGDVATALANNTPKLIEIARAANKLNPSLGTTTEMYSSLATGIKRSSPLILDNLGLTIKVGEANQRYADQLGKTVEELTATEKQQALLNETLRAGDVLIDQVGGNVESLTDDYKQLEAELSNMKDEAKASAATFAGPVVSKINASRQSLRLLNEMFDQGAISIAEYAKFQALLRTPLGDTNGILTDLSQRQDEYNAAVERGYDISYRYADATTLSTTALMDSSAATSYANLTAAQYAQTLGDSTSSMDWYATRAQEMAAASNIAGAAIRGAGEEAQTAANGYSTLSTSVGSTTTAIQKQLDFLQAGGVVVAELISATNAAIETGDFELAQKLADEASLAATDIELELGNITAEEAADKIASDLDIGITEAEGRVQELQDTIFAMTAQDYTVYIDVVAQGDGSIPGVTGSGSDGTPSGSGGASIPGRDRTGTQSMGGGFIIGGGNSTGASGTTIQIFGDVLVSANNGAEFGASMLEYVRNADSEMAGSSVAGSL